MRTSLKVSAACPTTEEKSTKANGATGISMGMGDSFSAMVIIIKESSRMTNSMEKGLCGLLSMASLSMGIGRIIAESTSVINVKNYIPARKV